MENDKSIVIEILKHMVWNGRSLDWICRETGLEKEVIASTVRMLQADKRREDERKNPLLSMESDIVYNAQASVHKDTIKVLTPHVFEQQFPTEDNSELIEKFLKIVEEEHDRDVLKELFENMARRSTDKKEIVNDYLNRRGSGDE